VTLATLLALTALAAEGRVRAFYDDARATLATPVGCATLAFMGWACVSILWSQAPGTSVQAFVEFFLTLGAAAGLALLLPGRVSRHVVWIAAGAVAPRLHEHALRARHRHGGAPGHRCADCNLHLQPPC
jgi:hypothetical protein